MDVTLISGIGKRIKSSLLEHGITDVPGLARVDLNDFKIDNVSKNELEYLVLQAQSLMDKQEKIS